MPKLTRYLQKIFANNSNEVGVFGTGVDKETSKNVETLQSADYEEGWSSAIITNKNYPIWQEMDGVQYGLSYQLKYLFQNGMPEWLSTETYYTNQYCSYGGYIYQSLQDDNINHNPALNDGYWTIYSGIPEDRLHALKSYLDEGELLTDSEGLADVKYYAKSSFDLSKFTAVGTPTITDNGIFIPTTSSTAAPTNYVSFPSDDTVNKIKQTVRLINNSNHASYFSIIGTDSTGGVYLAWNNGTSFSFSGSGFTDETVDLDFLAPSKIYDLIYERDGLNVSYTFVNVTDNISKTVTTTLSQAPQTTVASLQKNWVADNDKQVSYDLKYCSVEVNDVPVFSGNKTGTDTYTIGGSTVTIPYTLSKTGSKIVDSAYRTQVSSVYNAQGYAPYYTLSDNNFTLPMGEIYGLMLNQSTPHIVETYINGTSWYRVWSDGWCEQGGISGNIPGTAGVTVSLLKAYKDTSYAIFTSTTSHNQSQPAGPWDGVTKTTTQFALDFQSSSITGSVYWNTKGYIA